MASSKSLSLRIKIINNKPTQLSGFYLVELGGIEPPSKQELEELSTCISSFNF
jgi:hypothetical protein